MSMPCPIMRGVVIFGKPERKVVRARGCGWWGRCLWLLAPQLEQLRAACGGRAAPLPVPRAAGREEIVSWVVAFLSATKA